jgi:hypothetical protein
MASFRMNRKRHSIRFKKPSSAPSCLKLFNLQPSTFDQSSNRDRQFSPRPLPFFLTSLRPYFVCNSFPCHTYAKSPSNPFLCHTSKITRLKVLCLPHIRKTGGCLPVAQPLLAVRFSAPQPGSTRQASSPHPATSSSPESPVTNHFH